MVDVSDFWRGRYFEYDSIIRVANDWLASNPEWAIPLIETVFRQVKQDFDAQSEKSMQTTPSNLQI